ncbi:hypothetical protein CE195_07570 [Sodalis-like symbiont of Philaenus spumarius]|nr:hypothetical protein CE195_07570 [Sodalis-like symbiont of Philaenus spumarius]
MSRRVPTGCMWRYAIIAPAKAIWRCMAGCFLPMTRYRKFVVATQDAAFDNPYGFADLSLCFWPVTFKKAGWSFWMRFSEKYGTPWVVGRHPRGHDQAHIGPLLHSLEQMVQDAVAVIPDDSSIEFKEPATKGASSSLYKDLIEMARSEITIALLGQNQTTEAETNHASAQAGLEVAADIRDGDAVMVMSAVNQVIRWLVELNFGDVSVPAWRLWEQETIDDSVSLKKLQGQLKKISAEMATLEQEAQQQGKGHVSLETLKRVREEIYGIIT